MATEPKATKNLTRATNLTVNRMLAAVKKARASFFKSATEILEKPEAWSDTGRAGINDKADAIFRGQLAKELNSALQALAETAAESGNSVAQKEAGDAVPRFSKEYLADYLSRVTPKNAPSLAAVYTASMSESAKASLRQTVVTVFTTAAAAGLSTRERMKLFQSEWALLSKDNDPFRFVDKAGRRWENARYVQMLARTTAQRVQTAAFCDSMLQGGFPLARISNDSGHLTCGTCSEWQGRLIDLSTGHKLKGGTYTLSEARAAGVFHPNCTHRLEFVPLADYPDHLWKKVKDTIGEPDAFGRKRPSSHAGLPTKAQAEAHEKAVESAAKERALEDAKRRDAAIAEARWRDAIGKRGTWQELGLPDGKDIAPDPAEPKISVEGAKARLATGETVTDPLGRDIHFCKKTAHHIGKKGRHPVELDERLKSLDRSEGTVRRPHEIWRDENSGREKYIRFVRDEETGQTALNAVTENGAYTLSWHSNSVSLNHYRRGKLIYLRP